MSLSSFGSATLQYHLSSYGWSSPPSLSLNYYIFNEGVENCKYTLSPFGPKRGHTVFV